MKYVRWYDKKLKVAQGTEFVRCADGCIGLLWRNDNGEIGIEKFYNGFSKSFILNTCIGRYVVQRDVRAMIWKV